MKLSHSITIRKSIAAFLLVVFTISVSPKIFFHDLFAHHKDLPACERVHTTAAIHKQTINCHFDDLVVSSAFKYTELFFSLLAPTPESRVWNRLCQPPHSERHHHTESRGPPAC